MKNVEWNGEQVTPSKVVCVGRNYVEHIHELQNEVPSEPVIFIKPNSALGNELVYDVNNLTHYEGEISFIIQSEKLAGVAFGLDLTRREIQKHLKEKRLPWERAKAFDGSALFSPFVYLPEELSGLELKLTVNGEVVQQGEYQQMIYKPEALLEEIKSFITLEDGDIIMTGTPAGVGPLKSGANYLGQVFAGERLLVEQSWITVSG